MAKETKMCEALQKVLENLNSEDLWRFQKQLVEGVVDNFAAIPECNLCRSDAKATVRHLLQAYGAEDAAEICEIVLRIMNHSQLALSLAGTKGSLHPEVPYEQILYDGLKNQTVITVQGKVKGNADQFQINLYKDNDVAFHFNPRFNENGNQVIVRNSRIGNVWGTEERELSSFPFAPGKPFEVKILCTDTEFRVEVDKKPLLSFTHRIEDFHQIRRLRITGDAFIKHVNIDPVPLWATADATYLLNDVISENMSIIVSGHVKPNAEKFTIDVMKNDDILFHFKPYFSGNGTITVVRNSLINNQWGSEETETPSFPFVRGKPFLVKILCTSEKFKVSVDGKHLLDFKYRNPDFTKINKVLILQDAIVWGVRVEP